jgi:hypothetical protein
MYVYGEYSRDSVHARGPMTNSNYILGLGTGKQISPYRMCENQIEEEEDGLLLLL